MSSKTKVSRQVKVTQGQNTVTFELVRRGLAIRLNEAGMGDTQFVLSKPGMDALRELLGMQQPSRAKAATPDKPLTLTPEQFDERFERGSSPPREPDGTPTSEGLARKADGVEEGMGE